uniref:Selenoprotein P N-terminal domain-containing protein n=1 Tax=Oncorhynchus kisutch TaxID=8019 RepID=A0A8C7H216_ONCKI
MWAGLSLLLALCLLPGGGTESEGEGTRCKQPPGWSIGEVEPMKEVLGQVTVVALLQLEGQGLENVTYMVVNHQGEQAQRLHTLLRQKLSENITLYKQQPKQEDVWQTLAGEKDDFLIYDRCGRLTYHISLPYSILGTPYVENAIKETYCTRVCGDCTYETARWVSSTISFSVSALVSPSQECMG